MKTDLEFLDGVYAKAKELDGKADTYPSKRMNISDRVKQNTKSKIVFSFAGIAATICIVVAVTNSISTPMLLQGAPSVQDKSRDVEIATFSSPIGISEQSSPSPIENAKQAEIIVQAEVTKISKSVNEKDDVTTSVTLKAIDSLSGELEGKFKLKVNGGYIKKTESFISYQAYFEKGERVLLFLNKSADGYILSSDSSSKYTYQRDENGDSIYCSTDGNTISVAELEKEFSKLK